MLTMALPEFMAASWGFLLPLAIALPLAGALLAFLLGGRGAELLVKAIIPFGIAISIAVAGGVWRAQGVLSYEIGGWAPPLGVALRADGFSAAMLVTSAIVIGAASFFGASNFGVPAGVSEARAPLAFWVLSLFLWSALNCVFLGGDLFNLYVALELLTFSAVPLVCLDGRPATLLAAIRYLLFALFGSVLYLLGATLLYGAYGALDIVTLSARVTSQPATWAAAGLLTAGLLAKTALFPLHIWLPPAHAGAPAPASAMLSALVVKASFFLTARVWLNLTPFSMSATPTQILAALGAAAILFGSVMALRQARLKLLIAYSTVAQIGYLFLMLPLAAGAYPWSSAAWTGGVLQAVSHAFAKAAMFLVAGLVAETLGHDRILELRGLARVLPISVLAFALGGFSLMGLPPSGGFAAKWLLLTAAAESGRWLLAATMLAGGLLAAGYVFRVVIPAVGAPSAVAPPSLPIACRRREYLALVLALCATLLGFSPPELLDLLQIRDHSPIATVLR